MAIKKDTLDQLLSGRDPKEVFSKDGLFDELKERRTSRFSRARPLAERCGAGSDRRICADRYPARPRRERFGFRLTQADIAEQLKIDEKTLRKHFRVELSGGKFKVDMLAGKTVTELMKSREERVRLDAAKYWTARRMGWKCLTMGACSRR
jgi:hypothetical protein